MMGETPDEKMPACCVKAFQDGWRQGREEVLKLVLIGREEMLKRVLMDLEEEEEYLVNIGTDALVLQGFHKVQTWLEDQLNEL